MPTPYDNEHPDLQLARLDSEAGHGPRLEEGVKVWFHAAGYIRDRVSELQSRVDVLDTQHVWNDAAGRAYADEARKTINTMNAYADVLDSSAVGSKLIAVAWTRIFVREAVRKVCESYKALRDAGKDTHVDYVAHCIAAGAHTARLDQAYQDVISAMRTFEDEAPRWYGPLAAVPGSGVPASPGGTTTSGAGDPSTAGAGDPAAAEPQPVEDEPAAAPETADDPADLSDVLEAATSALGAAEGLLGSGAQVPDPASLGDLGIEPRDYAPYVDYADRADHADYAAGGQPTLAGLDAGASFGGGGGGGGGPGPVAGTSLGAGTVSGAGNAPVAGGFANTSSGTPSAAGGAPPMYPPNNGAGAAGARRGTGGIKPGDSGRPVAESRPRARRAGRPMTPGVTLAGRAGAATPKPAARRGWDSDNDSLQVLDENLWQVDPQEEETHEDRRQPGSAVRDRAAAQGAGHAGLDGQGRRAYPAPGAR